MAFGGLVEKIRVLLDTKDAKSKSEDLEGTMTKSFLKAQLGADALKKALGFMTAQLKDGIGFALNFERTTIRLQASLLASGQLTDRNTQLLEAQAGALERVTGLSDETIRTLQARGIAMGISVERTDDLVRASVALAQAMGTDATSAARALSQTQQGRSCFTARPALGFDGRRSSQREGVTSL